MTGDNNSVDQNEFQSCHCLLFEKEWSVQELATAIETAGCYGWDRFGRFKLSNQSDDETSIVTDALNALAKYRLFEISWKADHAPEYDEVLHFYKDELDQLKRFGWKHEDLPTKVAATNDPIEPEKNTGIAGMHTGTAYGILEAVAHLSGEYTMKNGNAKFKHGWLTDLANKSQELKGTTEDGKSKGINRNTFRLHFRKAVGLNN